MSAVLDLFLSLLVLCFTMFNFRRDNSSSFAIGPLSLAKRDKSHQVSVVMKFQRVLGHTFITSTSHKSCITFMKIGCNLLTEAN